MTGAGCWMVDGVLPDASPREVWEQGLVDGDARDEEGEGMGEGADTE